MRKLQTIDAAEAGAVVDAAAARATEMGVPQNIAIVDEAGHLVAFRRMDGAKFISIEIALAKAFTAAGARKATRDIAPVTIPGEPGFGIQNLLGGRFTTLAGGIPLKLGDVVVGAIGVSSGSTQEDHVVAQAGADFFASGRPGQQ
ncbi:GlcG/HbpS family heme-binding protein [Microvirga brassicacearum]|uniref:Heme-binding protein n=1 Tax=Microvirga brassicacearum TaxID=2580413 RepID=A0A5N3P6V1_9HYPH|nr:heme-binding protein [Microvirga brassicacearum]KAB0265457.1 heme-binding protein [Microvirga brassicacearum]